MYSYVWVIDDNTIDNYVTDKVLKKAGFATEVACFTEARLALLSLESLIGSSNKMPEVLFLDISMPVMNGFDFLDVFSKLDFKSQKKPVIFMLSSSVDQNDMSRALNNPAVCHYLNKPLTVDATQKLHNFISKNS